VKVKGMLKGSWSSTFTLTHSPYQPRREEGAGPASRLLYHGGFFLLRHLDSPEFHPDLEQIAEPRGFAFC
jgi:hypothetical protein